MSHQTSADRCSYTRRRVSALFSENRFSPHAIPFQPLACARPVRAEPDRAPPHRRRPLALFNWLLAHGQVDARADGTFLLRIEDTDHKPLRRRSRAGDRRYPALVGLDWDEGPDIGGRLGPYRQASGPTSIRSTPRDSWRAGTPTAVSAPRNACSEYARSRPHVRKRPASTASAAISPRGRCS